MNIQNSIEKLHTLQKSIKTALLSFGIRIHSLILNVEVTKTREGYRGQFHLVCENSVETKESGEEISTNSEELPSTIDSGTSTDLVSSQHKERLIAQLNNIIETFDHSYSPHFSLFFDIKEKDFFSDTELSRIHHVLGGIFEYGRKEGAWPYALYEMTEKSYKHGPDGTYIFTLPSGVIMTFERNFIRYKVAMPLVPGGTDYTDQQVNDYIFLTVVLPELKEM